MKDNIFTSIQKGFNLNISKSKLIIIFFSFLLFWLIDYSYRTFCAVDFAYEGYQVFYNFQRVIISVLLFIFFLTIFYFTPSTSFMLFINTLNFIFLIIPSLVLFKNEPKYTGTILFFTLLFSFMLIMVSPFKLNIKKKHIQLNVKPILISIFLLMLPFFIIYKFNFSINFKNFLHTDVHVRREAFSKLPSYLIYLYHWLISVIIPLFFANFIYQKKYSAALILLVFLSYLYLVLTHKSVFFSTIIILAFAFFKSFKSTSLFLLIGIFLTISIGIFLRKFIGFTLVESLSVRRPFIVPNYLNILYFDFFKHENLKLSYSILSPIFKYHHDLDPAFLLGRYYFNQPTQSVNNGFISQGYMDFGYIGIILYSLIIIFIIIYFNSLDLHPVYSGLFVIFFFIIMSSFIMTVLLTHGILLLMILSYFFTYRKPST